MPRPNKKPARRAGGFTLLELMVVLFILALTLGTLLTPLGTRLEYEDRKKTAAMLKEIRKALLGYVVINGRFPCPDCTAPSCSIAGAVDAANDGMEDVKPDMTCATKIGGLPWATLGVAQADAWGQAFIYSVDAKFAKETASPGISFSLTSKGNMAICDVDRKNVAQHVPALVFSLGANRKSDQDRKSDDSSAKKDCKNKKKPFFANDYIAAAGEEYDDMMIWIATPSLMYHMISAERLP